MKKAFSYFITIFTTVSFITFSLGQTVYALTWTPLGTDLGGIGDNPAYLLTDIVTDSSGILHGVAIVADISGPPVFESVTYGTFSSSWSWTHLATLTAPQDPAKGKIKIDQGGDIGIIYGYPRTDTSANTASATFFYHNASHLGAWTNTATVMGTVNQGGVDEEHFDFYFAGDDDPVFYMCDFQSGKFGLYGYDWTTTGVGDFDSSGADVYSTSTAGNDCSLIDVFLNNASDGHALFRREDNAGAADILHSTWNGSVWSTPSLVFDDIPSYLDDGSDGLSGALDSSGNPSFVTAATTATASGDSIRYGSWNGASWSTSVAATGLNLADGGLVESFAIDDDGTEYFAYIDTFSSADRIRMISFSGTSFGIETVKNGSSTGAGTLNPFVEWDSFTSSLLTNFVSLSSGINQLYSAFINQSGGGAIPEFTTYVYLFAAVSCFVVMHYTLRGRKLGIVVQS